METMNYLKQLLKMCKDIKDPFDYAIFYEVCKKYQQFKQGKTENKYITKKELIETMLKNGSMALKTDGTLPDDRMLRKRIRGLLKSGYPILASSKNAGYYVCDNLEEVDMPQTQNYDRAISILAVNKGYNKVRTMLGGQIKFENI